MPTNDQQTTVAAYFAEAASPSIIGTAEGLAAIKSTLDIAGRVLEQCGKSRRLLNQAQLSAADAGFSQQSGNIAQGLGATARDAEDVQSLLLRLAAHAVAIDAANAAAKSAAQGLGYVLG